MLPKQLHTALEEKLDSDVNSLYQAFMDETGEVGSDAFLRYLERNELLDAQTVKALQSVVQSAGGSKKHTLTPPPIGGGPPKPAPDVRRSFTEHINPEILEERQPAESDDPDDKPDSRRRTMFRRLRDGQLRETGLPERKKKTPTPPPATSKKSPDTSLPLTPPKHNRYQFHGTVGEGAMGRILLAEDRTLHRKVAFKEMSPEIAMEATLASKFTAEAQITAQLDHPNIVPVYSLESDTAYTMKLIKGRTLEEIVDESKVFYDDGSEPDETHSLNTRLELFLRICDALSYAHSRGVIHRDLKPENIMVGAFNELYVMDWGISRLMATGRIAEPVKLGAEFIEEGELIIGTPGYMSPEQAQGKNQSLGGASDQYAIGLILFEMVCLTPAVTGKTPLKIVLRHQEGKKNTIKHYNPRDTIPTELQAIIHKSTAPEIKNRYGDVKRLADDIRRYLRGEAVLAQPDTISQAALRWMGQHREATLALFGSLFILLLLVFGSGLYFQEMQKQQAREQQQKEQVLSTKVAQHSTRIDGHFLKFEGILNVVSQTALNTLKGNTVNRPDRFFYWNEFNQIPNPTEDSAIYQQDINLEYPTYVLSPGILEPRVRDPIDRLNTLRQQYKKLLLTSHKPDAASYGKQRAERAIAETGVPVMWIYIALKEGVFSVFPGNGSPRLKDFDARKEPWYIEAKGKNVRILTAYSLDFDGKRRVLTFAASMYVGTDLFMGVTGLDVSFDYLIEHILESQELPASAEKYLLDENGDIIVQSNMKGKEWGSSSRIRRAIKKTQYHVDEVFTEVKAREPAGMVRFVDDEGESKLVMYNRMPSMNWYFVVEGNEEEMLEYDDSL